MKLFTLSVAAGIVSVFCFFQAHGYVHGYARMYRPETQTFLDIVYDAHIPTPHLSPASMNSNPIDDIRHHLYQTENEFIDSLEQLDHIHPGDTTIVWEHSQTQNTGGYVSLLAFPQRLVKNRLKNIHFVAADEWRHDYPNCLLSILQGDTLSKRIDSTAIIKSSGKNSWDLYQKLVALATDRLKAAYGPYTDMIVGSDIKQLFEPPLIQMYLLYTCLADLEILYHILASSHHHIVVFAGGCHCQHIVDILQTHTTFEMVYSTINNDCTEIQAQELKRITTEHHTFVAGPGQLPNVQDDTVEDSDFDDLPKRVSNWEKCLLRCKSFSE